MNNLAKIVQIYANPDGFYCVITKQFSKLQIYCLHSSTMIPPLPPRIPIKISKVQPMQKKVKLLNLY